MGGTGVAYVDPSTPIRGNAQAATKTIDPEQEWQPIQLNSKQQLIAFEAVECGYCRRFDKEVLSTWKNSIAIVATNLTTPPKGWQLNQALFATPTIVLFRNQQEVARYTGYQGTKHFWTWLEEAASSQ